MKQWITIRLEDRETPTAKVHYSEEYEHHEQEAVATVASTFEVDDDALLEELGELLQRALDDARPESTRRARLAAAQAETVSATRAGRG